MTRALFLVLVLVAAAYAENYAFNQVDEIAARVQVCLKDVPSTNAFNRPDAICQTQARWRVEAGKSKESLVDSITDCMARKSIAASVVANCKQCLAQSLAKPLKPALEKANYSRAELNEISSRVKVCLSSIPETLYSTPATDCREKALENSKYGGYPKEALTDDIIVPCLERQLLSTAVVAAAQKCLVASLAKPL